MTKLKFYEYKLCTSCKQALKFLTNATRSSASISSPSPQPGKS